jgi:hypothetical protein
MNPNYFILQYDIKYTNNTNTTALIYGHTQIEVHMTT